MSKPTIHAASSAKQFGGVAADYLKIHDWFDQTKGHLGDNRHRAILHSSFGIFLCEQMFGHTITNSDGKEVSVRALGEQHCIEDLGFIPSVADYLSEMTCRDWMCGVRSDKPDSRKNIGKKTADATYDGPPKDQQATAKELKQLEDLKDIFEKIKNIPIKPAAPNPWPHPTYPTFPYNPRDITIID